MAMGNLDIHAIGSWAGTSEYHAYWRERGYAI